jgi:hypothetical protein
MSSHVFEYNDSYEEVLYPTLNWISRLYVKLPLIGWNDASRADICSALIPGSNTNWSSTANINICFGVIEHNAAQLFSSMLFVLAITTMVLPFIAAVAVQCYVLTSQLIKTFEYAFVVGVALFVGLTSLGICVECQLSNE